MIADFEAIRGESYGQIEALELRREQRRPVQRYKVLLLKWKYV